MSRLRRSALTLAAGAVGSVLVTMTGFVTTPVALQYLGAERFGAFRAAVDWTSARALVANAGFREISACAGWGFPLARYLPCA